MLEQTTHTRLTGIQAMFAVAAALTVGVPLLVVATGSRPGPLPAWLCLVGVGALGVVSNLTVHFWRIRPIAPGNGADYTKVVGLRVAVAALPAMAGVALSFAGGDWTVPILGTVLAIPGLLATVPGPEDFQRHVDLWLEVGDMPSDGVWGTADPHTIPPWEDPDGGHGHGIGAHSHGLH